MSLPPLAFAKVCRVKLIVAHFQGIGKGNAEFLSEQGHGNSRRHKQPCHSILRHDEQQRQSQHNAEENAKPRSSRHRHQFKECTSSISSPIRLINSLRTHSGAGCVRSVSFVGRKANRNKWKGAGFPRQASRNRCIRCLSRISSAFLAYHEAWLHGSPLFRDFLPLFQKRQTPPHHVRRGSARKHQKLRDISYLE